MEFPFDQLKK
jgi:hypothetical protein